MSSSKLFGQSKRRWSPGNHSSRKKSVTDVRRQLLLENFEARVVLAGTPHLIDINEAGASNPTDFTQVGSFVYFSASDGQSGRELWQTDGTIAGTLRVADIAPGSESSNPSQLTEFNGSLVFRASDGINGQELWISDGTESGTQMVRDINAGEGYQYPFGDGPLRSAPGEFSELNGKLYFQAEEKNSGTELWSTDGTEAGTMIVRDIAPGTQSQINTEYPLSSNPLGMTNLNGTLYFSADDGQNGRELWMSDGTEAGTRMVRDIAAGEAPYYYDGYYYGIYPSASNPSRLTAFDGKLFFTADDGSNGIELWVSDGTESGTQMIRDINPDGNAFYIYDSDPMLVMNGKLYFAAEDTNYGKELWSSDGTEAGTNRVRDIREGTLNGISSLYIAELNGQVYFTADDGSSGSELWKSDGSESGTTLVANIDGASTGSFPRDFTVVDDQLYFSAFTASNGREIWESDGTAIGTVPLEQINNGSSSASPEDLFAYGDTLLLTATDGTNGREIYAVKTNESMPATASMTIYVAGQPVTIPNGIGIDSGGDPISQILTINGQIVVDSIDGETINTATLGDFFETWRTQGGQAGNNIQATFDANELLGNPTDKTNLIQMFVNGQATTTFDEYEIRDGDQILITYGVNPVVSLNTTFGPLVFELFAEETPGTVENFLNYVNDGDYVDTFFHRSVPGFVIQGGGFSTTSPNFTDTSQFSPVPTDGQIQNEPGISNLRGTVAMAKLGRQPDSATSQFFVNLNDNSALDLESNDAFTVFAQVLDMSVADTIENIPVRFDNPSPFGELPLSDDGRLVVIESIDGLGTISGVKYVDGNSNGVFDAGDSPLTGVRIFVDVNDNGVFDAFESSTFTDVNGEYVLSLPAGDHRIQAELSNRQVQTQPEADLNYEVTVEIGRNIDGLDFGETALNAPAQIKLLESSDTGDRNDDNLTNRNNASADSRLQFEVTGLLIGSTVKIYSDGLLIGSATATSDMNVVSTDGVSLLENETHTITATQGFQYTESQPTASISITVDAQPPAGISNVIPDLATIDEQYTFDIDSNDEGKVTYSLENAPSEMSLDDSSGVINWTPTADQAQPHQFSVKITDPAGNVTSQLVDVTVLGVIPARPDEYDAEEDVLLSVEADDGLLTNDGDGIQLLTANLVSTANHGTVTVNPDGSFNYAPNANFFGTDSFTYRASDGTNDSNVAEVGINILPQNDLVTTIEDAYTVAEDDVLTVTVDNGVLQNDSDLDNDDLTVSLANQPTHGSLTLHTDGSFSYTPDADFFGTDSFAYRVFDGTDMSDPVSVVIAVTAVDDAPSVTADSYTVAEDDVLAVNEDAGVLSNDDDPDDDITATLEADATNGTVSLNPNGSFTYTPNANFFGTDSFTYTATDGVNTSTTAATITVTGTPDPPQAIDDQFSRPNNGKKSELSVLVNDIVDPDSDDILVVSNFGTTTQGGTVSLEDGTLFYTAPDGFVGTESFEYTITDTDGLTSTATATIDVTDASGNSISGFVYLDGDGNESYTSSDNGIPGARLTLTGTTSTGDSISQTTLSDSTGRYIFTDLPAGTYQVRQQQPTALMDGPESTAFAGATVSDNQILNIEVSGGTDVVNNNFGESQIHPEYISIAWFFASSTSTPQLLRTMIADAEERVGNVLLATSIREQTSPPIEENVQVPDLQPPVAREDAYEVTEDGSLMISTSQGVLSNDNDPDGDSLTATLVDDVENGTLTFNPNGAFTYTPSAGFVGTDAFSYRATDGNLHSDTTTVTITVTDVPNTFSINENSPTGTAVGQVSHERSGELSFAIRDSSVSDDLRLFPDDHLSGDPSAPFVLIEYLDLQCPNCRELHPIVDDLEDEFEGDLLVVRRHLPLTTIHPNARIAAINAEAAARQDAFLDMVDLMFVRQDDWASLSDSEAQEVFNDYAAELDLDLTQYASDLADPNLSARVQRDEDSAGRLNLQATPAFFLNGDPVSTADAFDDFEEVVEEALEDFDAPFTVDRTTGAIFVSDGIQLNFESISEYDLTVEIQDVDGVTSSVDVVVNLLNVNEAAPVAFTDTYDIDEDNTLTASAADGVLNNDTDADQTDLKAVIVRQPTNGTLTLSDDGSFTYVPTANFAGMDSFIYRANDGVFDSNDATVVISVDAINDEPIATADSYEARENDTLTTSNANGVLSNDIDADNDALTASLVSTTSNGVLTLNDDGGFTYTPNNEFVGRDSFSYQATDGSFSSDVVTVNLNISPINNAPEASNDSFSVTEQNTLTVTVENSVLRNDTDEDNETLTARLINNVANGTLNLNPDGSFVYTPNAQFNGTDSFGYVAEDGLSSSNLATVTITVNPINDLPQAVNDVFSVAADGQLDVPANAGILANDVDLNGDAITASLVQSTSQGTLNLANNGSFIYIPNNGFVGIDSFTYRSSDGKGFSNVAWASITVNPVNTFSLLEDTDNGDLVGQLQLTDADLDGDLIFEFTDASLPEKLRLAPDDHLSGPATAPVVLVEYLDLQCPGCAAFHPVVEQLEADFPDDLLVAQRHLPLGFHAHAIEAAIVAEAAGRQGRFEEMVTLLFDNQTEWSMTPDPSSTFQGYADSLNLDLTQFASDVADPDLEARVMRDNDDALDLGATGTPTFFLNGTRISPLPNTLANFSDLISDQIELVDDVFSLDRLTGELFVRDASLLDIDATPQFQLNVRVTDLDNDSEVLQATINLVQQNDTSPIARDDSYTVREDDILIFPANLGVLVNDSDGNNNDLVARIDTVPQHGELLLDLAGSFTYTPDANFNGTDSFTYVATDGTFDSAPATVTITVVADADAPIAVDDVFTMNENTLNAPTFLQRSAAAGVLANDSDPDGDALTVELVENVDHGALLLNSDGSLTYTPVTSFNGTDQFTYRISDGQASDEATVTIAINDVNQNPIARDDDYVTQVDQILAVVAEEGVLANDRDSDGDDLIALVTNTTDYGTLLLAADGTIQYTPDTGFTGTDRFTYQANDGELDSNPATVTVVVNPANTFLISEDVGVGSVVGSVSPQSAELSSELMFEFVDTNVPELLRLAPDDHLSGDAKAPVVLVEYLDFECPACRAYHPIVAQLEQDFDGELLVVRRHLPLTQIHSQAMTAAIAAEAAGRQNQFDAMADLIFANQNDWRNLSQADAITTFESYASDMGLNLTQFQNDMADPALEQRVQRDADNAITLGASGTPSFYVNGQAVTSLPGNLSEFQSLIQTEVDAVEDTFALDRLTGQMTVADPSELDFETEPQQTLDVRVTDLDGTTEVITITVNLRDVDDGGAGGVKSFVPAAVDDVFGNL